MIRRSRLTAAIVGLAAVATLGAGAAQASAPSASTGVHERPWACVSERDVNLGVCLYSPVPPPPQTSVR